MVPFLNKEKSNIVLINWDQSIKQDNLDIKLAQFGI